MNDRNVIISSRNSCIVVFVGVAITKKIRGEVFFEANTNTGKE